MTSEQIERHAEILSNRVRKRYAHMRKRFARQNIECFRLYDWDIPEVRAVVDWYAGHIVIAEYVRKQTGPEWLPRMAEAVARALKVSSDKVYIKQRRTKIEEGPRYSRMDSKDKRFKVQERDLSFWVNLNDFLDTGLYSDHRDTRTIIKTEAADKKFLNLFAYTGAFTCAAALGGAKNTTTVDRSSTYIEWAKDNLELNKLWGKRHELVQSDVNSFLIKAYTKGQRYTLAFIDPPSFFQDKKNGISFDVSRDHQKVLKNLFKVMIPGSQVFFSTNHQRFEPQFNELKVSEIKELTPATIPEDYRNRKIHQCWRFIV